MTREITKNSMCGSRLELIPGFILDCSAKSAMSSEGLNEKGLREQVLKSRNPYMWSTERHSKWCFVVTTRLKYLMRISSIRTEKHC